MHSSARTVSERFDMARAHSFQKLTKTLRRRKSIGDLIERPASIAQDRLSSARVIMFLDSVR